MVANTAVEPIRTNTYSSVYILGKLACQGLLYTDL